MDAQDAGLIEELYAREVIDERDKGDIEAVTSSIPRNEKLLAILGRKSKDKFVLFLDAMSLTRQHLIVSKLREHGASHGN